MANILVTGATGLIGRPVVDLLAPKHHVQAIYHHGQPPHSPTNVIWLQHDLSTPLLPSFLSKVDTIIHLAQSPHFRDFPSKALDIFDVNVGSTVRLLDWARNTGVQRFIFASSGGIYGHGNESFKEDDPPKPETALGFYLSSKKMCEALLGHYTGLLQISILRFFFVYGAAQRSHLLIPRLIGSLLTDQPVFLQGPDGVRINPIHVSDAAAAVSRCIEISGNNIINIAGPEVLTLKQVVDMIGKQLRRTPRFEIRADEQPSHLVGNIEKMTDLIGPPTIRFEEGIVDVCRAYRETP